MDEQLHKLTISHQKLGDQIYIPVPGQNEYILVFKLSDSVQ